jgi:ribosomal-protein-alanine N-acetyltransferase
LGLGYWIVPGARGRGLGTSAARLASQWGIRVLGAARVEAWVELDNEPSQRLLSSAGFMREGVLRAFLPIGETQVDAMVFSRTTGDLQA